MRVGGRGVEPWKSTSRRRVRLLFDEDPDTYDRTRPVPPDELFDDLVRIATLAPGSRIVEIGPGTGQATRPLAERGLRVLALEIGPRLAVRARENLAGFPAVAVCTTSFEAWDPGGETFDAVLACNSFHWIDSAVGLRKAASVLVPGGHLVVVSLRVVVPEGSSRFWDDVQDDWASVGVDRIDPATKRPELVDGVVDVGAGGHFTDPTVRRYPFGVRVTAEEYVANLSTQSVVKQLAPEARERLVGLVRRRIEAEGGSLTVHHLAVLTVARRVG